MDKLLRCLMRTVVSSLAIACCVAGSALSDCAWGWHHRGQSYSFVRRLGPQVALVAPDTRSERTKKQIVSAESWHMIFERMNTLPESVQHVVLLTTVPVLYPKVIQCKLQQINVHLGDALAKPCQQCVAVLLLPSHGRMTSSWMIARRACCFSLGAMLGNSVNRGAEAFDEKRFVLLGCELRNYWP